MKSFTIIPASLLLILTLKSCNMKEDNPDVKIIFLHHSTGLRIWGAEPSITTSLAFRFNSLYKYVGNKADLPMMFKRYNEEHDTYYRIDKRAFPSTRPYGWYNGPYVYYDIWVKHAGDRPYRKQPTLEMLTKEYNVIIFKHCFPVSNIQADNGDPDINSDFKSIANYKLQYEALKTKMHDFPDNKFILFTGAVQVKSQISEEEALRANAFFTWVREEWDQPGDNIFLWDLYSLETEGELYFKEEYAGSGTDSHPGTGFSAKINKLLFNRIIDVIQNDGNGTSAKGELIADET
jgi:hypothetical protein